MTGSSTVGLQRFLAPICLQCIFWQALTSYLLTTADHSPSLDESLSRVPFAELVNFIQYCILSKVSNILTWACECDCEDLQVDTCFRSVFKAFLYPKSHRTPDCLSSSNVFVKVMPCVQSLEPRKIHSRVVNSNERALREATLAGGSSS